MFVHGDNLLQKENHKKKYRDDISKKYLKEIREKYDIWKKENLELKGPFKDDRDDDQKVIEKRVQLFNDYKKFIDQAKYAEQFDSRSNLHSSVLEEFIYYLFKDLIEEYSEYALIGKSHAFKDIFFRSGNYNQMVKFPGVKIETKDHDFVIGAKINAEFKCNGMQEKDIVNFDVPAIAIECKTYLDKTMLEGSSTASEQLKDRNPNAIYIVVSERLKLTEAVNLKKYKVDQIYVLRKEKNVDREYRLEPGFKTNPIFSDVVLHLFNYVRNYLGMNWEGTIAEGIERGYLV